MRYDPEVLGILEEVEIRWLFDQFTRLLSPLIVLLDPELHTLAFVREEQPTLFLAIMFAATRFFHPTAHPLIKQLLETKISESTKTGNCHIATIQAIIILVFWQEPKDRSVWLKSGLAIRMAYQAGLNRTPGMSTSNRSISDIRRLRNGQRTWYCLICVDRYYSHIFKMPSAIVSDLAGLREWAEAALPSTVAIDNHLACSLDLAPLLKAHEDLTRSGPIPSDPLRLLQVAEMTKIHEAYRQYWLVDHAHKFAPGSFRLLSTHSAILKCDNSYARHVQEGSDASKDDWIAACLLALSNVAELSEKNDLEYWCVSAFTHISRFGTMIYAAVPFCDRQQLTRIVDLIDAMCQAGASNQHISVGDTWSTLLVYYSRLRASAYQHLENINATAEPARQLSGNTASTYLDSDAPFESASEPFDPTDPLWLYLQADGIEDDLYAWM